MSAGKTVSIRLPEGVADELRAATGQPVSTILRMFAVAYLERLRMERKQKEGQQLNKQLRERSREVADEIVSKEQSDG